jgi:endonuclease/exonuclease/phosphatase family metal-dependent hydrolase
LGSGATLERRGRSFCAATYNINCGINAQGRFAPSEASAVINDIAPDVVALQDVFVTEGGFDLLGHMSDATNMPHWQFLGGSAEDRGAAGGDMAISSSSSSSGKTPPQKQDKLNVGIGILSKYPISSVHTFEFSKWMGRPQRRALAVIVEHPAVRVWIVTLQMQHDITSLEQLYQARELVDWVETLQDVDDLDTLVCGGFNTIPCSKPIQTLNRAMDNLWLWGLRQGTYPSYWPVLMVDYIFLHRSRRLNCEMTTVKSTTASLHLPVISHFTFP